MLPFLLPFLLIPVIQSMHTFQNDSGIIVQSREIFADFFQRYNATPKIDLVFVLDRSGSVPKKGWDSMLAFVTNLLEHFTVDAENTRVAIVTFSTQYVVNYNGLNSNQETKCALYKQIRTYIEKQTPYGYTAMYEALTAVKSLLLNSRGDAKKAIFVLTDGKSNVGPPPVKAAFDILSLKWTPDWPDVLGPQVEIYAIGIQDAHLQELTSIAYPPEDHVFLIPDFNMFQQLARSLHGDLQEDTWTPSPDFTCPRPCPENARCTCGTGTGDYECVCKPGYEWDGKKCRACKRGYFKPDLSPTRCVPCSANSTTIGTGASTCGCFPPYYQEISGGPCSLMTCPDLQAPAHSHKYHVMGTTVTEVADTKVPCGNTARNTCHFQCDKGYRPDRIPALVCRENGSWSGVPPVCKIVDCGQIVDTDEILYVNGSTSYGSIARVMCQPGQIVFGDRERVCSQHGQWTGTKAKCVDVRCPPLPNIPYTWTSPHSCTQIKQAFHTECLLECMDGFTPIPTRSGDSVSGKTWTKVCVENGMWSGLDVQCKDTLAPSITCPDDITAYTKHGQNTTVIHWQSNKPQIRDNSFNYTYRINGQMSTMFSVGLHMLHYVATDSAGNQAECTRKIMIIGRHATVISCPNNLTISNVTGQSQIVTWPDPEFIDQDNKPLSYTCTRPSGDQFSLGFHRVHCFPEGFQDTGCHFSINITAKLCEKLPEPQNGIAACNLHPVMSQCSIMCNDDYEFAFPPADFYVCDRNGKWTEKWPHCSRTYRTGRARLHGEVKYHYYSGSCRDVTVREHIESVTWKKLMSYKSSICSQPEITCDVKDVHVNCVENETHEPIENSESRGGQGSENRPAQLVGQWENHGGRMFENQEKRWKRSPSDISKPAERNEVTFSVEFTIQAEISSKVTKKLQTDLMYQLEDIEDRVKHDGLGVNTSVDLVEERSLRNITVRFITNCTKGQVAIRNNYSDQCVNCPVGSYHSGDECLHCPVGFYQDEEGEPGCKTCPGNRTTLEPGAIGLHVCSEPCHPGTFSPTGLEPCDPCDLGTYQDQYKTTSCCVCPLGTGTFKVGSDSSSDCIAECKAGFFNPESGLEPCEPCPINTYQPEVRGRVCFSCPDLKETLMAGANSLHSCVDIDHCSLHTTACLPHGRCVDGIGSYRCDCQPGWVGDDCDQNYDECVSSSCQHGSTCVDGVNSYTCQCEQGYTGVHCDIEVNECDSSPCLHSGSCIDLVNRYSCYCKSGYGGDRCEVNIDACLLDPCVNGNCTDLVDGYLCQCELGYTGTNCDVILNMCIGDPCRNDATCTPQGEVFVCSCKDGYTGTLCELPVNECDSGPCLNGGTCHDDVGDYKCQCLQGFAGKSCQINYTKEFDLVFAAPTITDYVIVNLPPKQLTALTVSLWMRSHDQWNFGTPFSYSADSNWLGASSSDVFTLYDYGGQLFVNGEIARTGLTLTNGHWHHMCVSWEATLGRWQVYINGTLRVEGLGVASNTHIEGGGYLVLGQEQDAIGGGFNRREAFIGEISQLQVYDYVLSHEEISQLSDQARCVSSEGNVLTWGDFPAGIKGDVLLRTQSRCLDVNECLFPDISHCEGNHVCTDQFNGYSCSSCQPGYIGDQCDVRIDECHPNACKNNGTCIDYDGVDDWMCDCSPGFLGRDCYYEADLCSSMPCLNNGTCVRTSHGYKCVCPQSAGGEFCQNNYEACKKNPCKNNATCITNNASFYCLCPPGSGGKLCEETIDFCENDPCKNGGTCEPSDTGFTCRCMSPWVGKLCSILNEPNCQHFPCLNNGTCVLSDSDAKGYKCQCPKFDATWGPNCELPTSCDHSPCSNGGTCIHLVDLTYRCLCPEIYSGSQCEVLVSVSSVTPTNIILEPSIPVHMHHFTDIIPTTRMDFKTPSLTTTDFKTQSPHLKTLSPTPNVELLSSSTSLQASDQSPSQSTSRPPILTPMMSSTATLSSPEVMQSKIPEITPTATTRISETTVMIKPSLVPNITDLCGVTACRNGGTCVTDVTRVWCQCTDDYHGDYCNILRKKVMESYRVQVTLQLKYSKDMKKSDKFKSHFKKTIHEVYMPLAEKGTSKIFITINNIREGSVIVDFTLHHVQYEDEPLIDQHTMMKYLEQELKTGKLGDMVASEEFEFEIQVTKVADPNENGRVVYITAGVVAGCIVAGLVCLVIIVAIVRNRRRELTRASAKTKSFRKPYHGDIVLSSISNAAYLTDAGDDGQQEHEEPVYADVTYELHPYAVTTRADLERNESFLRKMAQSHPLRAHISSQDTQRPRSVDGDSVYLRPMQNPKINRPEVEGQVNQAFEEDYVRPDPAPSSSRYTNTGFCTYEYPETCKIERLDSPDSNSSEAPSPIRTPDRSFENLRTIPSFSGYSLNSESKKSNSSDSLGHSSESLGSSKKSSRDSLKRSLESLRNIGKTSPKVKLKRTQSGRDNPAFEVGDLLLPIFEESRPNPGLVGRVERGAGFPDLRIHGAGDLGFNGNVRLLNSVIPTLELPRVPPIEFNPRTRALPRLPYRQEEENFLRMQERERLQREYF